MPAVIGKLKTRIMDLGIINLTEYILGTIAIILLPGPNSMYVLTVAAQQGVRRGYSAAVGVFVGDFVLILVTVLGAATLLREVPQIFTALKIIGGLYLGYLGINMLIGAWRIWHKRDQLTATQITQQASALDASEAVGMRVPEVDSPFKRALIVSLINPKAILFLLSFFILFVAPDAKHPMWAFAALGAILQLFSFLYLSALIFAGAQLAAAFRARPLWMVAGTAAVGCLFVGFAIRLATAVMS